MLLLTGVGLLAVGLFWPAPAPAAVPQGVSLARDWVLEQAEAQPAPQYLTKVAADNRYCRLTGCTMTGNITMGTAPGVASGGTSIGTDGFNYAGYGWFMGVRGGNLYGMRLEQGGTAGLNFYYNGGTYWRMDADQRFKTLTSGIDSAADLVAATYVKSTGDTAANVQAQSFTGLGLEYDTTNSRARVHEGANWNMVPTHNPDAGAPYGALFTFTGWNANTTNVLKAVNQTRFYNQIRPMRVGFTSYAAGTGASNASVIVYDVTAGAALCTYASVSCTIGNSTTANADCSINSTATAAGHDIELRIDCTNCTTCPVGNVTAVLQDYGN